jgi:hypothetical protein
MFPSEPLCSSVFSASIAVDHPANSSTDSACQCFRFTFSPSFMARSDDNPLRDIFERGKGFAKVAKPFQDKMLINHSVAIGLNKSSRFSMIISQLIVGYFGKTIAPDSSRQYTWTPSPGRASSVRQPQSWARTNLLHGS